MVEIFAKWPVACQLVFAVFVVFVVFAAFAGASKNVVVLFKGYPPEDKEKKDE